MDLTEWSRLPRSERQARKLALAKQSRANPTPAEKRLLELARETAPNESWYAQKMVMGFIADVACERIRIVLEADGSSHDGREAYDAKRDKIMRDKRWTVLRFTNDAVLSSEGLVIVSQAIMSSLCGEKIKDEAKRKERKRLKNKRKTARKMQRVYAAMQAAHDFDKGTSAHMKAILAGG